MTIELWHAFVGSLEERLRDQLTDYHATQTQFRIEPVYKGNYQDTLAAGLVSADAGSPPALLQVFEVGTATLAERPELTRNVPSVMATASLTVDSEAWFPQIFSYFSDSDGTLLSMPFNISTPVLYLNKDLIAHTVGTADIATNTWEEVDITIAMLKDAGLDCPMTTAWPSWIHLENLSAYHDRPFADADNGMSGTATQLSFDSTFQASHIDTLARWSMAGTLVYYGRTNEAGTPFRSGDCALYTESSAALAGISDTADFTVEVRELPYWGFSGDPINTINGGASLWAMAGLSDSEYQAIANYFEFLTRPEVQAAWHQSTGYLPVGPAAYGVSQDAGYYIDHPQAEIPVLQMLVSVPTANSRGIRLRNYVSIRGTVEEEIEAALRGDKSAEDALFSAVTRGNLLLQAAGQ